MSERTGDYVICYDISDPKRLAKISRKLEKRAYRIQYSIFLLKDVTKSEVLTLAEEIVTIIDQKRDDVRIYKVKNSGYTLGCAVDIDNPYMWIVE